VKKVRLAIEQLPAASCPERTCESTQHRHILLNISDQLYGQAIIFATFIVVIWVHYLAQLGDLIV